MNEINYNTLIEECKFLKEKISSLEFTQKELSQSLELWETVFNSISNSICLVDPDGKILLANEATEKYNKNKENAVLGNYCYKVFHDADIPFADCPIAKMKLSQKKESLVTEENGKFLKFSVEPMYNKEKEYKGIIHLLEDITIEKTYEKEIRSQNEEIQVQNEEYRQINEDLFRAKNEAERSEKLKAAFLQNMSHEIRTPMNGIVGFSQLLLNLKLSNDKKNQYVNIINSNCQHLMGIINDIIDISKIDSGEVVLHQNTFSINEVFDDIKNTFTSMALLKNVELTCEKGSDDEHSFIIGDETKIKQVLINFVNNSLKFTETGQIKFGYKIKSDEVEFYVRDTGIGIAEKEKEDLFKRFFQASNASRLNRAGTGLGLAISKAYVEIMNGKLWFESKENKGSTFYFSVPFIKEKYLDKAQNDKSKHQYSWKGKTILIVEDDDMNFIFLNEILESSDVQLLRAVNGLEAIEVCRENKDLDLILMDIKMPVMNGLLATQEIRKFNLKIPIIAQTAYAFSSDKENSLSYGCNDYISKPIIYDILLQKIDKYLKK